MNRNNKSNPKKNHNLKIIVVIIVLTLILVIIPIILYISGGHYYDWDFIGLEQEKIEDGWLIRVKSCHKAFEEGKSVFSLSMYYHLWNHSEGSVRDINGKFNEEGTMIFFDNDFDNKLGKGDTFFIYDPSENDIKPGTLFRVGVGEIILK